MLELAQRDVAPNLADAKEEAYWRYNQLIDARNNRKLWSDPRAHNYYWTRHGRSATQNPFTAPEMWHYLRRPDPADLTFD
jgi:4-hydroxyacetophenone monooxygenase